jgi:Dyp-type peroxidase family
VIDLADVQSGILRANRAEQVEITFLRFATEDAAKHFLGVAADAVTTAADPLGPARNVAVTACGLRAAGIRQRVHDALNPAYTLGMRAAATRLQDVGASAPAHWEAPFDVDIPVHAAVLRYGDAEELTAHGGEEVGRWVGTSLGGFEPFGFRDGLSDPVVEGSGKPVRPGNGAWVPAARRWRAVRTGEFLLGHVDESGAVAGHPDAAHVERNGTYLVLRRLRQDVAGFEAACTAWAADLGVDADDVAARLVGRHRDGTTLGLEGEEPSNDFLYHDPGRPVAVAPTAHIRRSNPRDDLPYADRIVPRHLLLRRGYPYRDGEEQGLLFIACCADIRRQFEFVQSHWMQDGNNFGLGRERDPLAGVRDELPGEPDRGQYDVSIDHGGRRVRRRLSSFVTTRGGEYFLLAAPSALRLLAR